MKKVLLYLACSLDGYIAREDGKLDWLDEVPNPDKSDYGYFAFYDSIDTIMMGRKTYEEILGFDIPWPYEGKPTYIFSRTAKEQTDEKVTFVSGDIKAIVNDLQKEEGKNIWMAGGGELITSFLDLDLIDEMIITIVPTIIGSGLPLFPGRPKESKWELLKHEAFGNGMVNLKYGRR